MRIRLGQFFLAWLWTIFKVPKIQQLSKATAQQRSSNSPNN